MNHLKPDNCKNVAIEQDYSNLCHKYEQLIEKYWPQFFGVTYTEQSKIDKPVLDDLEDAIYSTQYYNEVSPDTFSELFYANNVAFVEYVSPLESIIKTLHNIQLHIRQKMENKITMLDLSSNNDNLTQSDETKLFFIIRDSLNEYLRLKKASTHEELDLDTDRKKQMCDTYLDFLADLWKQICLKIENEANPLLTLTAIIANKDRQPENEVLSSIYLEIQEFLTNHVRLLSEHIEDRAHLIRGLTDGNRNIIVPEECWADFQKSTQQVYGIISNLEKSGKVLVLGPDTSSRTLLYVIRKYYHKNTGRSLRNNFYTPSSSEGGGVLYEVSIRVNDKAYQKLSEVEQKSVEQLRLELCKLNCGAYMEDFKNARLTEKKMSAIIEQHKLFIDEFLKVEVSSGLDPIIKKINDDIEFNVSTLEAFLITYKQIKQYITLYPDVKHLLVVDRLISSGETMKEVFHILGSVINELKVEGVLSMDNNFTFSSFNFAINFPEDPYALNLFNRYQNEDISDQSFEAALEKSLENKEAPFEYIPQGSFPFPVTLYAGTNEAGKIVSELLCSVPDEWKMSTTGVDKTTANTGSISAALHPAALEKEYTTVNLEKQQVTVMKKGIGRLKGDLHQILMKKTRKALTDWIGLDCKSN